MKFGLFAINYGTCADPEAAIRVAQHAGREQRHLPVPIDRILHNIDTVAATFLDR